MKRRHWDLGFTVVAGAVIAFMAFDDGPGPRAAFVSSVLVAAALAWYFLYGRRHIFRTVTPRGAWIFVLVLAVLHLTAVWIDHTASFALFAWGTMVFSAVPRRPAAAIVAALTLLPVPMTYLRDGTLSLVHGLLPLTVLGLAFALLLGSFVSHLVEQNEERATMIAELSASRAEVARLSHEAGVATERARLAAEIHDTLAQGFTSIITLAQAAAADPAQAAHRLEQVAGTARDNLAEARALVAALTPADLHNSGLGDAVRRQLSRLASQTGIRTACHLDRRLDQGLSDLPTALQVVLLRCLQEALTNVRRHAHATTVDVHLTLTGTTVVLTITDDGIGFTVPPPAAAVAPAPAAVLGVDSGGAAAGPAAAAVPTSAAAPAPAAVPVLGSADAAAGPGAAAVPGSGAVPDVGSGGAVAGPAAAVVPGPRAVPDPGLGSGAAASSAAGSASGPEPGSGSGSGGSAAGSGFGSGFGLAGMRSRVEQAGGLCTVESRPGAGTTVTVQFA
ncbi:histidine kinase [Dactylosporangium sp. NBC_01737]|uniref:ATP-binding protein n=1 Tax=Dactylosporangium sp. NBC_01737 TaxID=2975959 RepID=UPI002E1623B3|nr:histidine kinase [Dactylosporangium sp. NBC_01737]